MAARVTDEMLDAFAVLAPDPDALPELLRARCRGTVDRLAFTAASRDPERTAEHVRRLQAG